jgi:hypothetical protein
MIVRVVRTLCDTRAICCIVCTVGSDALSTTLKTDKQTMPTLLKKIISQAHEPDPQLLETLLQTLKFPRCCVCDLGWFEEYLLADDVVVTESRTVNEDDLLVTKCKDLIPLPRCSCTTTLMTNAFTSEEYKQFLEQSTSNSIGHHNYSLICELLLEKFCYQDNFQKYYNTAMCKQCLYAFVSSSEDVIEHDYMSETQPNIKFSVGGKCPCCRRKFTARSLHSLVQSIKKDGDNHKGGNAGMMLEWVQHNANTIKFIKFAKKLKRILVSSAGTAKTNTATTAQECGQVVLDIMDRWIHDTEEHLSDDCFSDHEMESVTICPALEKNQRRGGIRIIAPDAGEIRKDLLEKDPKFRQECEDLEYIQKMSSTAEGRRALGIESPPRKCKVPNNKQLEQDEQFARKLACEWNGENRNNKKEKSPLLKYFSKVGHTKGAASRTAPGTSEKKIKKLCRKKQETSSIDSYMRSWMEESSADSHGQIMESKECRGDSTCSISKGKEKDEILFPLEQQANKETIVIFDSDDEKDNCDRVETLEHSEQIVSTTSPEHDTLTKCSPTSTSLDIFNHDETLHVEKCTFEELELDKSKGHDDSCDNSRQGLPQILNSQDSNHEATAQKPMLNEDEVMNMIAMGFSRQECLEALQDAENNRELAVNLLLDRRLV